MLLDIVLDNYSPDRYGKRWRLQANVTELMFTIYDIIKDGAVTSPESEIRPNTYWVYKYALDRLLDIYYMTDISLDDLSEKLFVSPKTISRIISAAYGKSFNDMKFELRIRNAKKLLKETSMSVTEIGEKVGYTTDRGFFSAFQKYEGCTPGEYRKKANAEN
jgi:AraC-like DNA-binding protein